MRIDRVNLQLPSATASLLADQLSEEGATVDTAGASRGLATDVQLVIVATPSLAVLGLVVEKLRRLRLPRTYMQVRDGALEVWTDPDVNDGRAFVVDSSGTLRELQDNMTAPDGLLRQLAGATQVD